MIERIGNNQTTSEDLEKVMQADNSHNFNQTINRNSTTNLSHFLRRREAIEREFSESHFGV